MKLEDVLGPYKYFEVAKPSDNEEILTLFKSMTMDMGSLALRYDRGNDFFAFLREQCEMYYLLTMKNEDGSIRGLGSLAFVHHFINGQKELCVYLGDLRISPLLSAKVRIRWKQCYSALISNFSQIEEFKGVRYLYSAILDDNIQAMKSLVKNNKDLIYHPLTSYQTLNIYAYNPFAPRFRNGHFQIEKANLEQVRPFLAAASMAPGLQYYFTRNGEDELLRRTRAWRNFNPDSFFVVKNKQGKIVATCAPWICETKKLVVTKIESFYRLLGKYIFPMIGLPKLTVGEEIKILYLSNLVFDPDLKGGERTEALTLLIRKIMRTQRKDFHLISLFDFPAWELEELPFFMQKTKATLFQVMGSEQVEKGEFINLAGLAPAFGLEVA